MQNPKEPDKKQEDKKGETHMLYMLGCRRPIALHNLAQNIVPAKAALGPKSKQTGRRSRVVACFLGLSQDQKSYPLLEQSTDQQEGVTWSGSLLREDLKYKKLKPT